MKNKRIPLIFLLLLSITGLFAQHDKSVIMDRITGSLLQSEVNDSQIEQIVSSLSDDGTWPGIDYTDVSRTGFEHRFHTNNMVQLAVAYRSEDSKFHQSDRVLKTIELALKNWTDNDYFCDNWWHNQIGTPNSLVAVMLLVGNELDAGLVDKAQKIIGRAHVDAPGARPGGDRIKIAGIEAKNLLFLGNVEKFDEVVRVIEKEIKFVKWIGTEYGYGIKAMRGGFSNRSEHGRGIQYDYSFHHRTDGVNNTLSYGLGYADAFVEWAVYTRGTQYAFSEEQLNRLIDYFLDGICKTAVYGKYPDPGAKNRSISREGALHPYSARTAERLLLTSEYRKSELQEIADIRNKGIKPTLSHATYYWHSEHFSFQRPDFFTSVRLYSTRTYNMEQPYNSEGLFNHHRGDGANHISVAGTEYDDIAPVFDFQKIPGTTTLQKPEMPSYREIQKLGITDFAGALTDGKYGAVGFDFKSPHDPICARKSWFFFDNEYVCLGAGISGRPELPVFTTLNQCHLRGDVLLSTTDGRKVLTPGEKKYDNTEWIFHDGVGYVFPEKDSVSIKTGEATGSWYRINKQTDSPKDEVKMDVFTAWIDHGVRPQDQSYQYIVVPATTVEDLERGSSASAITILENTPELQAVVNSELGICQAVFYKAGELRITEDMVLSSHTPGIVMLTYHGNKVTGISVADPNRELRKMHLSLSTKIESRKEDVDVSWDGRNKQSEITIDMPWGVYAGKSITIQF